MPYYPRINPLSSAVFGIPSKREKQTKTQENKETIQETYIQLKKIGEEVSKDMQNNNILENIQPSEKV